MFRPLLPSHPSKSVEPSLSPDQPASSSRPNGPDASNGWTRREWLSAAAAASVAGGLSAVTTADDKKRPAVPEFPQIDAHSHIWTRDTEAFPLAEGSTKDDLDPPSFTTEELLEVAHANRIGRVVLIQHHLYHGFDNSYMIDAAERYPGVFRVVGMVDDRQPHPGQRMRELARRHVSGFRITSSIHKEKWLDGSGMAAMWETAAETGQAICCLINPDELPAIDRMCQQYRQTPVVIDHFGRVGIDGEIRKQDLDNLCRLARHPRTYLKVSAFYALGNKQPPYLDLVPMIRRVLDAFGPERAMWASDSPYQLQGAHTYSASVNLIRDKIDFLTDSDRDWLLRKTAEKVYFSDLTP